MFRISTPWIARALKRTDLVSVNSPAEAGKCRQSIKVALHSFIAKKPIKETDRTVLSAKDFGITKLEPRRKIHSKANGQF